MSVYTFWLVFSDSTMATLHVLWISIHKTSFTKLEQFYFWDTIKKQVETFGCRGLIGNGVWQQHLKSKKRSRNAIAMPASSRSDQELGRTFRAVPTKKKKARSYGSAFTHRWMQVDPMKRDDFGQWSFFAKGNSWRLSCKSSSSKINSK